MRALPPMVDMALTPQEIGEEKAETAADVASAPVPKYPWGLSLCFDQDVLDKLKLSADDVQVGDIVHLFCFAKVTSVSINSTDEGDRSRVELQIVSIASEDEDAENEDMDAAEPKLSTLHTLYGG